MKIKYFIEWLIINKSKDYSFITALRLGLAQSKLGLIHIIKNYELSPCDKTLIPMKFFAKALATSPDGGELYLNFRKLDN